MTVSFRNVLVATIERGTIGQWLPLIRAIERSPWGPVARRIDEYLSYESPYGVAPLLRRTIARTRRSAEEHERDVVAGKVRSLIQASGLSNEEFARSIGTSRSRLSTYASGKVIPAATLLVRMAALSEVDPDATQPWPSGS